MFAALVGSDEGVGGFNVALFRVLGRKSKRKILSGLEWDNCCFPLFVLIVSYLPISFSDNRIVKN